MPKRKPSTKLDFPTLVERYESEEKCREYLEQLRWPDGPTCPKCGHKGAARIATRSVWECNARSCRRQYSVRFGTPLQDSKLPLWMWFVATYMLTESKKGMSANQLKRMLGVTYKSAWFLTHRIRTAMSEVEPMPLLGTVEVDETYIGGKKRRPAGGGGRPGPYYDNKAMVLGAVQRGGDIRLRLATHKKIDKNTARVFIDSAVADGAERIYTDGAHAYRGIGDEDTLHASVDHHAEEWVRGDVHTNSVESVWSLFKRSIVGSYHHLSTKHLASYLSEFEWRFNRRHNNYLFRDTLRSLLRTETMTYKNLIKRPA